MTLSQIHVKEKPKTTHRLINLRNGDVRCPYHDRDVNAIKTCIDDSCQFYERIRRLAGVDCIWTAADGQAEEG